MISLNWPIVLTTTGVLYGLILLTLPFSPVYATLFLFTLIAFWSRLPGVGIPTPYFPIIWVADFVDLFALIVSINLGGFAGVLLSIFANLWGRMCGIWPGWRFTFEDAFSQAAVCMIIPYVHIALGGDILVSMMAYTIIRAIVLFPINLLLRIDPLPKFIIEWTVGIISIFIINSLYARIFGDFFDNLLQKGVSFSWILFLIATAVIIVFYVSVFGAGDVKKHKKTAKKVVKVVRKRITHKKEDQNKIDHINSKEMDEMQKIKDLI